MPQVGSKAPSFELQAVLDGEYVSVNLDDYRGKWVVLFFYPLDFTFVCPTELRGFSAKLAEFNDAGAEVIACSTDSRESHLAWLERDFGSRLGYALLADPKREVSRDYDVYMEDEGHTLRATFIIDPEGVIRWALMHDTNVGRSTDEVLRSLQALQTGELCPVDWVPGEATLRGA
jgi:peroxiredoxin (alkyl hydroperoxide reductase subunit C)